MPNKSKAENAAALLSAGIPRKSWSIPEFCARHGISPGLYDKLKKLGLGPHETKQIQGKIYLVAADPAGLLRRYERDFPEQSRKKLKGSPDP